MIVAIDGPAGSGKSTVTKLVAERLGWRHLDTGAMYRALALKALKAGVSPEDGPALAALAAGTKMRFHHGRLLMDGQDVSHDIRTPEVGRTVSAVSAFPDVREIMVGHQRRIAEGDVVVEGRDIGTAVFPDAEVKCFLTATPEERIRRRLADLEDRGIEAGQGAVAEDLLARDKTDSSRAASPLSRAVDSVEIDTTDLSIEEVAEAIVSRVKEIL